MDLINLLVLFGLSINFFFALVIRFRSSRSRANTIFELTVYAIIGWCLSMFLYRGSGDLETANFWARMLYLFPTFIPTGFFLFGLHFPDKKVNKIYFYVVLTLNSIMAILTLIPGAVIESVTQPTVGEKIIQFGWAYPLYLIYIPGFFIASYYVLIKDYRRSNSFIRAQIQYILLGLVIASNVGMITNLILPTFGEFDANWMGQFFTFIWVGGATYAIVKHNLMDIKVFATQVLIFAIWIVLFSRLFIRQTLTDFTINFLIFITVFIFGILLIRSVKKEVKQRQQLQELNKRLKDLDAQKDEFISMAAHELRAPITAIKGYVSMILEGDTGDIPEKARRFLADANNINERLIRLVNNMLNVSRIEEGRMAYQEEEENLSALVRTVFSQFVPEAEGKELKYKLEIPSHIKDRVHVDSDKIQEVVGNFLSNAIKYTDTGSVTVRLTQPNAKVVRFEVIDTGPGISKEEQVKLFQKFYRVESNVGKTTGTGLGLYISRLLIEKFGGKIGLESYMGKGSTFWFELPLVSS